MLAEAILRILKDQNLAKKMGERGHQIARANFSVETMVRNYERLFSGIDL
jgi:glycosyltransferase involved in cell wall biosynthesis